MNYENPGRELSALKLMKSNQRDAAPNDFKY